MYLEENVGKVENIQEESLDSIPSPSPSVKFKYWWESLLEVAM